MKSGIELIANERAEQICKHGRTVERDVKENRFAQLIDGAMGLMLNTPKMSDIPSHWDAALWQKMCNKSYTDRLIIAGALIAAELDRIHAEVLESKPRFNIQNVEVFNIETKADGLYAHISFQDINKIDDINHGYDYMCVPIKPRLVQMSTHGNPMVNQSECMDVDVNPEESK